MLSSGLPGIVPMLSVAVVLDAAAAVEVALDLLLSEALAEAEAPLDVLAAALAVLCAAEELPEALAVALESAAEDEADADEAAAEDDAADEDTDAVSLEELALAVTDAEVDAAVLVMPLKLVKLARDECINNVTVLTEPAAAVEHVSTVLVTVTVLTAAPLAFLLLFPLWPLPIPLPPLALPMPLWPPPIPFLPLPFPLPVAVLDAADDEADTTAEAEEDALDPAAFDVTEAAALETDALAATDEMDADADATADDAAELDAATADEEALSAAVPDTCVGYGSISIHVDINKDCTATHLTLGGTGICTGLVAKRSGDGRSGKKGEDNREVHIGLGLGVLTDRVKRVFVCIERTKGKLPEPND
jgi:hypothetical protein